MVNLEKENIECDVCNDTGEVDDIIFDEDCHEYISNGTKKCICKRKESDESDPYEQI